MSLAPFNWHRTDLSGRPQWFCYKTPVGVLLALTQGNLLCKMQWLAAPSAEQIFTPPPNDELQQQLHQYWLNAHVPVSVPLMQQGTAFQRRVWSALCRIPFAQTRTYGELAKELNTGPRALANACRKNPFPLIIPCHRVLAKAGIGGYAGAVSGKLIAIKTALLHYEQSASYEL